VTISSPNLPVQQWHRRQSRNKKLKIMYLNVRTPLVKSKKKNQTTEVLQTGLEFDNSKPRLENGVFKMHFVTKEFGLWG
jgi:hypothetical protein